MLSQTRYEETFVESKKYIRQKVNRHTRAMGPSGTNYILAWFCNAHVLEGLQRSRDRQTRQTRPTPINQHIHGMYGVRLHQSPTFSVTHHVASSKRCRSNTKPYTTDSSASDLRSQRTSPTIHQSHTPTSSFSGAGSPSTALPITSCADPSTPTAVNPSPPAFWSLDIYREPRALQAKGITRCQDRPIGVCHPCLVLRDTARHLSRRHRAFMAHSTRMVLEKPLVSAIRASTAES
jgi:hypothetical protein